MRKIQRPRERTAYAAPAWAGEQRLGSPGMKALLLLLANYADENDSCFPGQATLASESEQSRRTVMRQLATFEEWGLIRRERRVNQMGHRTSDRFYLNLDLVVDVTAPDPVDGGPHTGSDDVTQTPEALGDNLSPRDSHAQNQTPKRHQVSPRDAGQGDTSESHRAQTQGDTSESHRAQALGDKNPALGDTDGTPKVTPGVTGTPSGTPSKGTPSPAAPSGATPAGDWGSSKEEKVVIRDEDVDPRIRRAKKATRIPTPFPVSPTMVAWAQHAAPLVDGRAETEKFQLYWEGKSSEATKVYWLATWRKWMLTAQEEADRRLAAFNRRAGGAYRNRETPATTGDPKLDQVLNATVDDDDPDAIFGPTG